MCVKMAGSGSVKAWFPQEANQNQLFRQCPCKFTLKSDSDEEEFGQTWVSDYILLSLII